MSQPEFLTGPEPPYYAVIFTSLIEGEAPGYDETAERMVELAQTMQGFLGLESTRNDQGYGITVSYWETEEDIRRWKSNDEHRGAQERGKHRWYERYSVKIARVERVYEG